MIRFIKLLFASLIFSCSIQPIAAQFLENFDNSTSSLEEKGWSYASGDGFATMDFIQKDGYASVYVDATKDKRNIWWALIRCQVPGLDLEKLTLPNYELRVEAKIKVSQAPRRVNLHFNHQRTTDFHSHLMEYDIPDTLNWYTISLTTQNFDAKPGDQVNAQMALMDWGLGKYRIDIDYFKVDVVNRNTIGPDKGMKMPYHPPLVDPETFQHHILVLEDATIDGEYTDMNFNNWQDQDKTNASTLLSVNGTQIVIMRWDLGKFKGKQVSKAGLLELTIHSVQRDPDYAKDFGSVRITEILGGDPRWEQETVTYDLFCNETPFTQVLNTQMIIDGEVKEYKEGKALFTISKPVLQRLIDGKTLGLAIKPLGAVHASFYAMENEEGRFSPKLHFDVD